MSSLGVGPLVRYEETMNADKYVKILQAQLIQVFPFLETPDLLDQDMEEEFPHFYFVQDNATSHTAYDVTRWRK